MLAGVTIVDPATTWIEADVELEPDVDDPSVHRPARRRRGSRRGAEIDPHAVAVDAAIGPERDVGPFCYLRPGTVLEASAKAGTFVEIKNSHIGERTKVPHLSYIGDAEVGEDTNIARRRDHRQLPAPGRAGQGPDDDRQQRQDRRPQWVRRAGRGRRRCMDRSGIGDHRRTSRPDALAVARAAAGQQGGICRPRQRDD